jgi:LacI family transcriptional regulator
MASVKIKSPLKDIAGHFGVNVSTVSRALAGDSRISDERRNEIRSYAESLNYSPDIFRRKRRNAIGLMLFSSAAGQIEDHYQRVIVREVSSLLYERGYHVHVEYLEREASAWPAFLRNGRVDGVLVTGHPPLEVCQRLREAKVPAVIVSDSLDRTSCFSVRPDPANGTIQALQRLLQLGHKRIAFASSSREYPTVEQRYKSFCFALMDAGLQPDSSLMVFDAEPNIRGGRDCVRRLLAQGSAPSAIVFVNDYMALGGMMELLARGFKLPGDISIVGHDNSEICGELEPGLSSVDLDLQGLIAQAFELLRVQLDENFNTPVERVMKSVFVERESVAACRN